MRLRMGFDDRGRISQQNSMIRVGPLLVDFRARLRQRDACCACELRRRGFGRANVPLAHAAKAGAAFVSPFIGRLDDVEIIKPTPAQFELVQNNYLIIARMGGIEHADIEGVRAVGQDLATRGADAVILAGTELSLAFTEATADFPALDSGRVHIDAIVARAFSDPAS